MTDWITAVGVSGGWGLVDPDQLATRLTAKDGVTYLTNDSDEYLTP